MRQRNEVTAVAAGTDRACVKAGGREGWRAKAGVQRLAGVKAGGREGWRA